MGKYLLKKLVIIETLMIGIVSLFIVMNYFSNNTISKINRILNKCSDDVVDYIYNLIHNTFYFIKNLK